MKYLRALISASTEAEAHKIAAELSRDRLCAGTLISSGTSIFWWEKKLQKKTYWNISAFTRKKLVPAVMKRARELQKDETPVMTFYEIAEANKDFLKWIRDNTR